MKTHKFELFLKSAKHLLEKETLLREERFKKGDDFNIFEIMGVEADEVSTHSTIIAHLLNPNGSHGCADTFLKLFLSTLSAFNDWNFVSKNAVSEIEYLIGPISKSYNEGGRIDILIETADGKNAIIIENKIYASDQPKQLIRYYNYAEQKYGPENYKLLYLTLQGREPSVGSIKGKNTILKNDIEQQDFFCVSYAVDIIQWLEKCLEKAVYKPILRETIAQYIYTLKKITNLQMETNTKQELTELCLQPENIDALLWIRNNSNGVINEFIQRIFHPQLYKIAAEMEYKLDIVDNGIDWINTNYMRFSFCKNEWNDFEIAFEFQSRNLRKLVCGVRYKNGRKGNAKDIYDILSNIGGGKKSVGWPFYRYRLDQNWLSERCFEKIKNGDLAKEITKEIEYLSSSIPKEVKI